MENKDNAIEVRNLTKEFYIFEKDYQIFKWLFSRKSKYDTTNLKIALDNITLDVKKREIVGVIGKNGAGKSTLMKLVAGITFPTYGSIETEGRIGSLINLSAGFNHDFTGRKNLYYKGMLMGMSKDEIDNILEDIIDFVDLGEYFDLPLRMYSSGMSARLGFGLAVFSDPDILIVDEVFSVGDKNFQTKSREKTTQLFEAGKSVLFASHSDDLIKSFCNRVVYIKDSKIAFEGDVDTGLEMYNEDVARQGRNKFL